LVESQLFQLCCCIFETRDGPGFVLFVLAQGVGGNGPDRLDGPLADTTARLCDIKN
jgi:hypothetical protein